MITVHIVCVLKRWFYSHTTHYRFPRVRFDREPDTTSLPGTQPPSPQHHARGGRPSPDAAAAQNDTGAFG